MGASAGLAAFIITWSIGQPLAVPQVGYTFWILLGSVAAVAGDAGATEVGRRRPLLARIALATTIVFVVGSVPIRASRDIAEIDLSRVSYGFYNPGTTEDNTPFRWAGPRATLFMRSPVTAIELPLAALHPTTPQGVAVDILVDGRMADHVVLTGHAWHTIRINTPASARRFWRIDLHVTPIGIPPTTPDEERRVAVGTITIKRGP